MTAAIPPHDLDSEESLLGSMLLSREAIRASTTAQIDAADFYKPTHGLIFDAIIAAHAAGNGVDPVTVAPHLRRKVPSPLKELRRIEAATPASANAQAYARTVKSLAQRRALQVTATDLAQAAATGDDLDRAKAALVELARRPIGGQRQSSLVNAAELVKLTFPPQRWAVPGIVAEGLNLLVGPPKLGKSWFALSLAVATATGGRALGRIPVEQGPVLYLALEDGRRRLQTRLTKLLAGEPAPEALEFVTEWDRFSDGGDQKLRAHLDEHPDTRLVIVDVWAKARARSTKNEGQYDQDYNAASTLQAIATDYGVAILVVHHTRKSGADDYIDTVSGTHGLAGAADAILVLDRSRGSAQATLRVTGRDVEEAEHALTFAADIGAWQMLDGPATDYVLGDTRRKILQAVRADGALTPSQIAKVTGIKLNTVKGTAVRMAEDEQLDTDGQGHYSEPVTHVTRVTGPGEEGDEGYVDLTAVTADEAADQLELQR